MQKNCPYNEHIESLNSGQKKSVVFWILIQVNVERNLKILKILVSIPVPRYPVENLDIMRCILFPTFAVTQAVIRLTMLNRSIRRKNIPIATLSTDIYM